MISIRKIFANIVAVAGNYLFASGKTEQGVTLLRKAVSMNTTSPAAHLNLGITLVRAGEGEKALPLLEKAASFKPKILLEKNIRLTTASCYWTLGQIEKAREILEKMRADYEYVNAHVLTTLGYMYFLEGDLEKAEEVSRLAVEDTPESGAAWDNLGQIYYRQGDREKAKETFEKAVGYKNDLPDSLYYLGCIAEEENDSEKAAEYFSRAAASNISALNTVTRQQVEERYNLLTRGGTVE